MASFTPTLENCEKMCQKICIDARGELEYEKFENYLGMACVFLKEADKYPKDSDEHTLITLWAEKTQQKIIEIAIARNFPTTCDCWDGLQEKIEQTRRDFY